MGGVMVWGGGGNGGWQYGGSDNMGGWQWGGWQRGGWRQWGVAIWGMVMGGWLYGGRASMPPSSSGSGHLSFKEAAGIRLPLGVGSIMKGG